MLPEIAIDFVWRGVFREISKKKVIKNWVSI